MSLKETNEIIAKEISTFNARRSLLGAVIIIVATFILNFFLPEDPADFGVLCTIPALIVPLVIIGVIPKIGPMKKAYQRVAEGGPLAPEGSDRMDICVSRGVIV